ncbi:PE-PPE domain-containing protein, partial [Mycobacterium sp.]|uniref:PE family protein n=1 Tax=Mycobacterium sp. TaxID=1785 RepID=UPI0025DFD0B8
MTSMIAQPQIIATAAADASAIGSALNEAKAAAAGPTTSVVAAAADEVSAVTAQLFGGFGQHYQGLLSQAAAFHNQFVETLASAGNTYSQAEGEIAGMLGLGGGAASPTFGAATPAADPPVVANLIMTGSGTSNPSTTYMNAVYSRYLSGVFGGGGPFTGPLRPVSTNEGLYPVSGVKDLVLDTSVARGITELNNAINLAIPPGGPGAVSVFGYSQSAIIASDIMPKLLAEGYTPGQVHFALVGDELNPNGGLLSRFPGLNTPSVGIQWGGATPSNDFPTTIWTAEYDGFADFPRYPIDIFSDLNAVLGIAFVHGTYPTLTASQLASSILLPGSASLGTPNSMTDYYIIPTQNLPLLDPVRALPVIGTPVADLLQPDLRYLVNWGYGNPNFGWSTSPANVPTPFGFLPPPSDTTALGPLLVSGAGQGTTAFLNDLSHLGSTSGGGGGSPSLPSLTGLLSGLGSGGGTPTVPALPSISSIISGIQTANTNVVSTFTNDLSTAYATLLPTADIGAAIGLSLPSYDVNLFLGGVGQALSGNPVGLLNAIGEPIAADIGLTTVAGGIE